MMRFLQKILILAAVMLAFWACAHDDDGPLPLSSEDDVFAGQGFFLSSELDSGELIYLVGDTLYLHMDSIWSFSNCALQKIGLGNSTVDDSILIIKPYIDIRTTNDDCASPVYAPDTTLKIVLGKNILKGISTIRVMNDVDSILDTILVRRGDISVDTFKFYIDSLFDSVHSLPLRTKNSPSVLKVLDSLTPRVFLWRTMKSNCELRIDMCDSVRADTLFPALWRLGDTNLVPVHYACKDSDLVYCHSSRWVDDSSSLGELQERPDTVWHMSTYYMETIPECGSVNTFSRNSFLTGGTFTVIRGLYSPDESETSCGPSTREELYVFDLTRNRYVPDTVDVDSLYKQWESAKVVKSK